MIIYYIIIALSPCSAPPLVSRIFGSRDAFKILGGICVIYAIFYLLKKGTAPQFFKTWQARGFVVLVALAAASELTMGLKPLLGSAFVIYIDIVLFFFVTLVLVDSVHRLEWALLATVAGVAYASVDVIREWWRFHSIYPGYRAGTSVGDPNYFATSAVIALPFAFFMILHGDKRWKRLFCLVCLPISLLAIAFTGSRGGLVALVVAFLLVIWFSQHRARNLILACILIAPFLAFAPSSPVRRLLNPDAGDKKSEEARLITWRAGLNMFEAHPLTGVGLDNFELVVLSYEKGPKDLNIAHNSYIELLAELGFAGPILFLIIVIAAVVALDRARRQSRLRGPPALYYCAMGLEAGLTGFLVGAIFLSAEYVKLLWMVVFLSICVTRLVRLSAAAPPQGGKPVQNEQPLAASRRHPDAIFTADRA